MIVETRPWGRFVILYQDKDTWLKRLIIAPGQSLSLQKHHLRDEWWYPLDDGIAYDDGKVKTDLTPYETYYCLRGEVHRLTNTGQTEAQLLEWAVGFPTEEDIDRLEDNYGRS
jgi:mannose-6-phosphate isomerase-like protein (cupin superfamily)